MASGMTASAGYPFGTLRGTSYLLLNCFAIINDAKGEHLNVKKFSLTYQYGDLNSGL